jgi:hypothetical protein
LGRPPTTVSRHSTSLPIPTPASTLAITTRPPTLPAIPGLACYSAPYGPIGFVFHLYLYFLLTRLIIFRKNPISWIFGGPTTRLKYHDINATLCILPGLASCIITAVSFFGCADRDAVCKMKGYFLVSAVMPLALGVGMAAGLLRENDGRRWSKRMIDGVAGGGALSWYLVALVFGLIDVVDLAKEDWTGPSMEAVCLGTLGLFGILSLGMGLFRIWQGNNEDMMLVSTVILAMAWAPLLMDTVLMLSAPHGHGYPMAMSGKILGMLLRYIGVWILPLLCVCELGYRRLSHTIDDEGDTR